MITVDLEVDTPNPIIPWQKMSQKTPMVQRKCSSNRKYVPLKARTKTMDDLKQDEVSKQKEITEKYLKQYQTKQNEPKVK